MRLWAVVIEDPRRDAIDRVLLYAADKPEDAKAMARDLYLAEARPPLRYRFWAQPVEEVQGTMGSRYKVVLRRLATPRK